MRLTGGNVGTVGGEGRRVPRPVVVYILLLCVEARVGIAGVVTVGYARVTACVDDAHAL